MAAHEIPKNSGTNLKYAGFKQWIKNTHQIVSYWSKRRHERKKATFKNWAGD